MSQIKIRKEELINAMRANHGIITYVAESLGVGTKAVYASIERYELHDVVRECRSKIVDLAEKSLIQKLARGDTSAILFSLRTLGKDRGYQESMKVENNIIESKLDKMISDIDSKFWESE